MSTSISPVGISHMATTISPIGISHMATTISPIVIQSGLWRMPTVEELVLLMAISANCILIFAPLRAALRAARQELCIKELVGLLAPTYMLFGQSYFWACYGLTTSQPDISHFNAFGAGMCIVYLGFITRGARPRTQAQVFIGLSVALVIGASSLVYFIAKDRNRIFAYCAMFFSMLQSLAPMYQAVDVLRAKSPAGFPLAVTASSCISSLLWAQYAIMVHDQLYFLSNAINTCMGVIELVAVGWASFHAKFSRFDADHQPLMPRAGKKRDLLNYSDWHKWSKIEAGRKSFPEYTPDVIKMFNDGQCAEKPRLAANYMGKTFKSRFSEFQVEEHRCDTYTNVEELCSKRSDGSFRGLPDCIL